jgi:hypothetical protein
MVHIEGKEAKVKPDEVLVNTPNGAFIYPRAIKPLELSPGINPGEFVQNTWNDEAYTLSASPQLHNLNHERMNRQALERGFVLARVADIIPYFREVNLALQGEGVVYDASGKLIEDKRLEELGRKVNNLRSYYNDRFEKGRGFKELDLVYTIGIEGEELITERSPLEEYVIGWAKVQGRMNSQGYLTEEASEKESMGGEKIDQIEPIAGRVARFRADSRGAYLFTNGNPRFASPRLGGILRAEGISKKGEGEES